MSEEYKLIRAKRLNIQHGKKYVSVSNPSMLIVRTKLDAAISIAAIAAAYQPPVPRPVNHTPNFLRDLRAALTEQDQHADAWRHDEWAIGDSFRQSS